MKTPDELHRSSAYWQSLVDSHPELIKLAIPKLTKYIPHEPLPKQAAFLLLDDRLEVFFGGAAGGGKSEVLLMGALQYVDVPGYSALLLRRSYGDLALPDALMERAAKWLRDTDASWNARTKTWVFPSSATLTFGYLESEKDVCQYQSAELQYIGFDELTQFLESQYVYLLGRLHGLGKMNVPLRMRSASNPGNVGHGWVKERFITPEAKEKGRIFVPAFLDDNPYIDRESYKESLAELDPATRAQLLRGDWDVAGGSLAQRHWFEVVREAPAVGREVRFWNLPATGSRLDTDPDWTVGVRMLERNGVYYLTDVQRAKLEPSEVERLVYQTAQLDGKRVGIGIEQEPGASGKSVIHYFVARVLSGFTVVGFPASGDKIVRARSWLSQARVNNIKLLAGPWNEEWLNEVEAFPHGVHYGQVDATSGAFGMLETRLKAKQVRSLRR